MKATTIDTCGSVLARVLQFLLIAGLLVSCDFGPRLTSTLRAIWQTSVLPEPSGLPVVVGSRVLAAFSDGHVRAFDLASGTLLWESEEVASWMPSRRLYVSSDSIVIVQNGYGVIGLDVRTGRVQWHRTLRMDSTRGNIGDVGGGTLALVAGGRRIAVPLRSGSVVVLRTADGERLWQWSTTLGSLNGGAHSVRECDGRVLVAMHYGATRVASDSTAQLVASLDAVTGAESWRRALVYPQRGIFPELTGLECAGGRLYMNAEHGFLWSLRLSDGVPVWTQPDTLRRFGQPDAVLTPRLLIVDNGHPSTIGAYTRETGALAWRHSLTRQVVGPLQYDGRRAWYTDGSEVGYLQPENGALARVAWEPSLFQRAFPNPPVPVGDDDIILTQERRLKRMRVW